jgi:hypothetical protein
MKNQGQLPADLVDALQPTIHVADFYYGGRRETIPFADVGAQGIAASSNFVFPEITVPNNEVWWVHGFLVQVSTVITGVVEFQACHYSRNLTPIHCGPPIGGTATAARVFQQQIGDFLAQPGDAFGLLCTVQTTAASSADACITFSRFTA